MQGILTIVRTFLAVGVAALFSAAIHAQTPPTGIYASSIPTRLGAGGRGTHSVQEGDVTREFVSGVLVVVYWKDLEPTQGTRDWTLLDNEFDLADSYAKKVTLAVLNGPSAPAWLESAGAQMFTYTFRGTPGVKMPVPWDPIYLNAWTDFVAALGQRYADRPTIALV
ncbi:MAG: beta-galactosidase, partial [Burkholderiales bacterium]